MVDRPNKPTALTATPGLSPQPQVNFSHENSRVSAVLPTGESLEILLYGATVISWKDAAGREKLWLSEAAKLDGSKAVRGGIPLVFPVFGTAPNHKQTGKLPQHGFARNSRWEFLGKSTSEGQSDGPGAAASTNTSTSTSTSSDGNGGVGGGDDKTVPHQSVKLDFGLGPSGVDEKTRELWPFAFGLVYSVTLNRDSLTTTLVVTNDDDKPFDVQVLMHTYLRVHDITRVTVAGLDGASYIDKVDGAQTKTQSAELAITGETDRVYTLAEGTSEPVSVREGGKTLFRVVRDNLADLVVWNPWANKTAGMSDFAPQDGYKNMLCIEVGAVKGWQTLEAGDSLEGSQTITML